MSVKLIVKKLTDARSRYSSASEKKLFCQAMRNISLDNGDSEPRDQLLEMGTNIHKYLESMERRNIPYSSGDSAIMAICNLLTQFRHLQTHGTVYEVAVKIGLPVDDEVLHITGIVDSLHLDREGKKIYVNELKTHGHNIRSFPRSVYAHKLQTQLYTLMLSSLFSAGGVVNCWGSERIRLGTRDLNDGLPLEVTRLLGMSHTSDVNGLLRLLDEVITPLKRFQLVPQVLHVKQKSVAAAIMYKEPDVECTIRRYKFLKVWTLAQLTRYKVLDGGHPTQRGRGTEVPPVSNAGIIAGNTTRVHDGSKGAPKRRRFKQLGIFGSFNYGGS